MKAKLVVSKHLLICHVFGHVEVSVCFAVGMACGCLIEDVQDGCGLSAPEHRNGGRGDFESRAVDEGHNYSGVGGQWLSKGKC